MTKKTFTTLQKLKFTLVTILFFLFLILVIGEIFSRIIIKEKPYFNKADLSKELGWVNKPNLDLTYDISTYGDNGAKYPVHYTTEANGFRAWGDIHSNKKKVFFIGDSYVQSVEVSTDSVFYNHLKNSLDIEVFAYGHAGYGNLQEKIILEKYKDTIKPDLIVLQVCDNDFVDNHAPLEYKSNYRVGVKRPYYDVNGRLIYRKAVPKWQEILDKSKFLKLLRQKIKTTLFPVKVSTQKLITEKGKNYKPYNESVEITKLIFKEIKASSGDTPLLVFSASSYEPYTKDIKEICKANDIPFTAKIGKHFYHLKNNEPSYLSSDGYHWSPKGQKRVAEMLAPFILQYLPKNDEI